MSPKKRLVASTISSIMALLIFKLWIYKLGIPGIDWFLAYLPIGSCLRFSQPLA